MARRASFKRPLNDGDNTIRIVKRQNSEGTLVAETGERLSLVQLTSAPVLPPLDRLERAHEVPSVSPRNQRNSDVEKSFYPDFFPEDCGREPIKPKKEPPPPAQHRDQLPRPVPGPLECEECEADDGLMPVMGLGAGRGRKMGGAGLDDGGIMVCCALASDGDAEFDAGDGGSDADACGTGAGEAGTEAGVDEPDGHLQVIEKSFRVVEEALCDACSSTFNMIKAITLPFDWHHDDDTLETDGPTEGFPIHIPHPEGMARPVSFGMRLRKHGLGYQVTSVRQASRAWDAGIRDRDILTHLDQTDLRTEDDHDVLKHFMQVKTKFCLTFLREVQEHGTTKLLEIKICVTIIIDVAHHVIEVKVKVSRSPVKYKGSSAPLYIVQQHDNKHPMYLNMEDRRISMGTLTDDRAKFQLDFYAPSAFKDGQLCVIRKCDTQFVLNAVRGTAQVMEQSDAVLECLINKEYRNASCYVFQSSEKIGSYMTKLSDGSLALAVMCQESIFDLFPFRQ